MVYKSVVVPNFNITIHINCTHRKKRVHLENVQSLAQ